MPKINKTRSFFFLIAMLVVIASIQPVYAKSTVKVIPVEIRAQAYDPIGQALARQVIDNFKQDKRFEVVSWDQPKLVIHLSTMGYDGKEKVSAYGYSITFDLPGNVYQTYIGGTAGVCTSREVPDDAKAVWYNTNKLIENYSELVEAVKVVREK